MSFFRKRVFYNNAPSYKRETRSVKCRGAYLVATLGNNVHHRSEVSNEPSISPCSRRRRAWQRSRTPNKRVDSGNIEGRQKKRIESDRRLSLNQETIKSSRNRAARLTSETESDMRRDQKKTLVNKYIVDLTCVYYFLIKRKKLFGQSSTYCLVTCSISTPMCPRVVNAPSLLWDVISFLISCSNRTSFSNDILYRHSLWTSFLIIHSREKCLVEQTAFRNFHRCDSAIRSGL